MVIGADLVSPSGDGCGANIGLSQWYTDALAISVDYVEACVEPIQN